MAVRSICGDDGFGSGVGFHLMAKRVHFGDVNLISGPDKVLLQQVFAQQASKAGVKPRAGDKQL